MPEYTLFSERSNIVFLENGNPALPIPTNVVAEFDSPNIHVTWEHDSQTTMATFEVAITDLDTDEVAIAVISGVVFEYDFEPSHPLYELGHSYRFRVRGKTFG